jgi:uncharacterized protein YjiS (DUF1127 family)
MRLFPATTLPASGHAPRRWASESAAVLRQITRCMICYLQVRNEQRELARLSQSSLRDIGLNRYDVAMNVHSLWARCWRSVRS